MANPKQVEKTLSAGKADAQEKAAAETKRREALMITMGGRRVGKLYFTIESVENDPESMAYILGRIGFFPFRTEARVDMGQFELIGLSPSFNRIPVGHQIPIYAINVEQEGKVIEVILQQQLEAKKSGVDLILLEDRN